MFPALSEYLGLMAPMKDSAPPDLCHVVLADFAQLTPDRSAMVTSDPHHSRTLRVVLSGVAPRGPQAVVRTATTTDSGCSGLPFCATMTVDLFRGARRRELSLSSE